MGWSILDACYTPEPNQNCTPVHNVPFIGLDRTRFHADAPSESTSYAPEAQRGALFPIVRWSADFAPPKPRKFLRGLAGPGRLCRGARCSVTMRYGFLDQCGELFHRWLYSCHRTNHSSRPHRSTAFGAERPQTLDCSRAGYGHSARREELLALAQRVPHQGASRDGTPHY